jgi:hypothetical protein
MKQLAKHIYRYFKQRTKSYLENPVLVYQMGKVASSSICDSLRAMPGVNAFHAHRLNPENIERVKQEYIARGVKPMDESRALDLYERLIKPERPAKVISLFREPISRNISAYFQNLAVFEKNTNAYAQLDTEELITNFMHRYNHDVPLNWFDIEIKSTLGIDVYAHPFPRELGYQTLSSGPYDLLLMRHDLDDRLKADLIRDFLGLDSFSIKRVNEGNAKEYASSYQKFLDTIRIPRSYVQRMLHTRYARHFFTTTELDKIERHWTRACTGD